jgi:hypothetical protein
VKAGRRAVGRQCQAQKGKRQQTAVRAQRHRRCQQTSAARPLPRCHHVLQNRLFIAASYAHRDHHTAVPVSRQQRCSGVTISHRLPNSGIIMVGIQQQVTHCVTVAAHHNSTIDISPKNMENTGCHRLMVSHIYLATNRYVNHQNNAPLPNKRHVPTRATSRGQRWRIRW